MTPSPFASGLASSANTAAHAGAALGRRLLLVSLALLLTAAPGSVRAAPSPAPPPATNAAALQPVSFTLLRQSYGYWTHFLLFAADGAPAGVVERRHWRQPLRRNYESFAADGTYLAQASQPLVSFGNVKSWYAQFSLTDAAGTSLAGLSGRLWTLRPAAFTVTDAAGYVVADAVVDTCGQSIVFLAPNSKIQLASFVREQQASQGNDRWNVRIEADELLPAESWPLLAAFFADAWRKLGHGCPDG